MLRLKLCFVDYTPMDYTPESPYLIPLGGSQSALCYLTAALAERGHQITLLNYTQTPGNWRGVTCIPLPEEPAAFFSAHAFDAVISLNSLEPMTLIRPFLSPEIPMLLWTQHAIDQPAMVPLRHALIHQSWDHFIFVSHWQRASYLQAFGLDPARTSVRLNAIGTPFHYLFPDRAALASGKAKVPTLAYTSSPGRGLTVLLDIFPLLREVFPQLQLKVFSSMQTWQQPEDEPWLQALYKRCRETEHVTLVGSLPQPELARELAQVHLLTYPNIYNETSCIALMEAMACGCDIVSTALGALPETTAGYAHLVAPDPGNTYVRRYVGVLLHALMLWLDDPETVLNRLSRQVLFANTRYTWQVRVWEWESLLYQLCHNRGKAYWPADVPLPPASAQRL
jgi:glycosyltransferase involved in cell wall biosynthesis